MRLRAREDVCDENERDDGYIRAGATEPRRSVEGGFDDDARGGWVGLEADGGDEAELGE